MDEAKHKYRFAGEHQVMVKVVDVFGSNTNKILKGGKMKEGKEFTFEIKANPCLDGG